MSSMLTKSLKSGFKPKVARRNGTASTSQNSERLSKTPAPTASQSQPPPPPAPSSSSAPSVADKGPRVPETAPHEEEDRAEHVPKPEPKRKLTEKGSAGQHTVRSITETREAAPASSNIADPLPQIEQPNSGSYRSPAGTPIEAPEPASTIAPPVTVTTREPRSSPAREAASQPAPRTRTRKSRATAVQEETTQPVAAPQADNELPRPAAPESASVFPTESESQVEEQSDALSRAAAPGRKRRTDATAGEESSDQASGTAAPAKKPRVRRAGPLPGEEGYQTAAERRAATGTPKQSQKRKSPTEGEETPVGETGDESGGAQWRKRVAARRQREATPEDAENVEIDVTQVKMADLIKDMRVGKKFSLHDELMERERMKRQKYKDKKQQEGDAAVAGEQTGTPAPESSGSGSGPTPADQGPPARTGPSTPAGETYQIIDGVIVVDARSLRVDRHARAAQEAGELEEHEENEFTHHTTSATYLRRNMRPKQWADDETDKFFWALSMFGTDFETIAKMFPGKTRKHIKLKFNREERAAPARIQAALVGQKTVGMDMDEYKRHTGAEYETAEAIYAEQKKAEDEFEARQKALQEEKEEEARKKREELFGSGNKEGENQEEGGKKKRGRGRKAKRTEVTW